MNGSTRWNISFSEFDGRFITMSETLNEKMTVLAAAQSRTDERLNSIINVVERYITHNGHAK